ncbi:MAG: hypothetical protein AB7S41_18210 [Parvibaculaceae bacterium]
MTAKIVRKRRRRNAVRSGLPGPAGSREPNGRLSRRRSAVTARRVESEAEVRAVAVEARMRHTGLPRALAELADAGRPNAGTVHGRMRLREELTADQWTAAEWYLGTRTAYLRAIGAPGRPIEPSEGRSGGEDTAFAKAAIARHDAVVDCLRHASIESRSPIIAAFDAILWRQEEFPHLTGDLRLGLNAVHRAFLAGRR